MTVADKSRTVKNHKKASQGRKDRTTARNERREEEDSITKKAVGQFNWQAGICAGLIVVE